MPCKYLTVLPPIPRPEFIGNYVRLEPVRFEKPYGPGYRTSHWVVTIENAVGGTYGYSIKTRKLAMEFIEKLKSIKPVRLIALL